MVRTTQRLTKGETVLLVCIGLFVAVILGGLWWWTDRNATPQISIPTPEMPVPNARQTFIDAADALVDMGVLVPGAGAPPSPPAAIDAALKKNAPAFAALRKGFTLDYREEPVRSLETLLPHFAKYRNFERVLHIDATRKAARGDWNGAMQSRLDGIQLGTIIPRGGTVIAALVGYACAGVTRTGAWDVVPHLSAAQAQAATRRMEAISRQRVPPAEILEEEKWAMTASFLEVMRKPGWRKLYDAPFDSKRAIIAEYQAYMDGIIRNAGMPYAAHLPDPPLPRSLLAQQMLPVYEKYRFKETAQNTQDNLLLVTLALQAYRQEHKTYPATLEALAPAYLDAIPGDPFALRGAPKYRRTAKGYILYSVGPDGKDDGGTPSADGQGKAKGSDPLSAGSTGDVVAGVIVQ